MLLQNTLDLSTFEIVRFRIWNQTSNPNDYGIGTKYFNTNSGHEGYNRENIYTATGWRRTAYMDDIEAITNGEGSLGVRVKTLEDMLGLEDVTDVIDTWNDVKAFFANVDEGLTLMTMLDGKLNKTGGTMTGNLVMENSAIRFTTSGDGGYFFYSSSKGFSVANNAWDKEYTLLHTGNALDQLKGTFLPLTGGTISVSGHDGLTIESSTAGAAIKFKGTEATKGGYLIYGGGANWHVSDDGWATSFRLLHSGNVGEYALKVDGSNKMTDGLQLLTMSSGTVNVAVTEGLFLYSGPSSGGTSVGLPDDYVNAFNVGGANAISNLQLAWRRSIQNPILFARIGDSSGYSDWKTLAFTDSDITGNAATATKLKTAVSLWGNEFDGTQDISGSIRIKDGENWLSALEFSNSELHLGYGTRAKGLGIWGAPIEFFANSTKAMTITEGGNVLVGTGTSHENAQLFSGGLTHVYGYSGTPTLGSAPSTGLIVGSAGNGLAMWSTSGAGSFMQAEYFDGTSTALALNLNPLGGAVNVASTGAWTNIYGPLGLSGKTADDARIAFNREGVNYITFPSTGSLAFANDLGTESIILRLDTNRLYPNVTNAVSLGESNYRWSSVYSVNGDFSGRVLIGGAQDDENYGLIAKGGVKFYDSSIVDYLIKGGDIIVKIQDTYTSSFRFVYGLQIGQEQKASFGFAGTVSNPFAFIGQNSTRWFTINSTESNFNVLTNFNAGALIPTGQKMTFGADGPTIEYDEENDAIKVTGNLYTTGTLSSGGKAEEGEGGTGGGSGTIREFTIDPPADNTSSFKLEHSFNTEKVIVQIFELNGNSGKYEMILTDVEITDANNVTVTFGRKPTEYHKVYVMA